jgi:uncharacterized iron-regulated membrane protein
MNEDQTDIENHAATSWGQHRFMLLVGGTILISLFLVGVALALYASSGAAQLDLSRPGYTSVRDQVSRSESFDKYSATGPINKQTLDQFRTLYTKQAEQATSVDSFGGNVISDQTLAIDPPTDEAAQ